MVESQIERSAQDGTIRTDGALSGERREAILAPQPFKGGS